MDQMLINTVKYLDKIKPGIDLSLGRRVFNTTQVFTRVMRGRKELKKFQKASNWQSSTPPSTYTSELKKNGFAYLTENFYPANLVSLLEKKIKDAFENQNLVAKRGNFSHQIKDIANTVPEITQLITPEIISTLEHYYKTRVNIAHVGVWRNYYVPEDIAKNQEVYSDRWHFDHNFDTLTKLFYYVNEVTEDDGPHTFQSAPRSRELMKKGFIFRGNVGIAKEVLEDSSFVNKVTGKPGTSFLINHCHCMHKAGIVKKEGRYRDLIQFLFLPGDKPTSENWIKDPVKTAIETKVGK